MNDPITGVCLQALPVLPPAPTTKHSKGDHENAVPASQSYRTTSRETIPPSDMLDEKKLIRSYAKVNFARYGSVQWEDLCNAVGIWPLGSAKFKIFVDKWSQWTQKLQRDVYAPTMEDATFSRDRDPDNEPHWFGAFVAGSVMMHDYHAFLNNLWRGYQSNRFTPCDETTAQESEREERKTRYITLFRQAKDAYLELFEQKLNELEAAVESAGGLARIRRAKERLDWVRGLKDFAQKAMWPEVDVETAEDLQPKAMYYKDFTTVAQRSNFWSDDNRRWGTEIAARWLHALEPEVNLAASFANEPFWKMWSIRWAYTCDTAWRYAIRHEIEGRVNREYPSLQPSSDDSISIPKPDILMVYAAARSVTFTEDEPGREFGGIEIVRVPRPKAKRGREESSSPPTV